MIRILCVTVVAIAITGFGEHPTQASEAPPWCAVISLGDGNAYWDCQYRSLEECIPNVLAGNRGFCNPNPAYHALEQPPRKHTRRRHKII